MSTRVEAIRHLAERHAPGLDVRMASAAELTPSLFAWAAVTCGDLPPALMPEASRVEDIDWLDVFSRAPSALLRCLTLLVPRDAMRPLDLARSELAAANPTEFLGRWSGNPMARTVAALLDRSLSPAEFDGLVRTFRGACLQAMQKRPHAERRLLRRLLHKPLLGRRIPPVLSPALERLLSEWPASEVQTPQGWQLEVGGFVLARAKTLDQLRGFALAETPTLIAKGTAWQRIKAAMDAAGAPGSPGARGVLVVEPGFVRHLVALVPRNGRPRVHRVDAAGLLRFALTWHRAGVPLELVPTMGCDPTLLARAAQLLKLRLSPHERVAFQVGREVLLLGEGKPRVLSIDRAFARPRSVTWLPEQAEHLRALRKPSNGSGLPTVHVVALPDGDDSAAIFALDAQGQLFREQVPRHALEQTLQEYREILRNAGPPSLVSATVHPFLTSLDCRRPELHAPVVLDVECTKAGDRAWLDGELFGSGSHLSWSALAEAVLSHWPPGVWARVIAGRVFAPPGTNALVLLAARSRVLRRLQVHLRRIALSLRAA
ncbi:MAG: hypothetical protein QM817_15650 [Archangium sp.]